MNYARLILACGAVVLLLASAYAARHVSPFQIAPANNRPVIGPPVGGGWSAHHHTPPAPTGSAAIGSAGHAQALFTNITAQAGLKYHWAIFGPRPLDILQTIGNGCAFLDYNNSGNLSILLVGPTLALYKGDGHGHFTDVTHQTGLDKFHGHFLGCAVGDYDNDGYDDLYISGWRTGLLLHNHHGQYFQDVTQKAGLKPQPWGTSCAWGDIDGSGRLSLYVGDYAQFDPKTSQRLCVDHGYPSSCGPLHYLAADGVLYQNLGGGKFRDVSAQWDLAGGKTLGAAFADYQNSGHPSLYLANDELMGDLLENRGGKFADVGRESGTGYDGLGHTHGGMGVDWGDYDNDGRLDLFVAAFSSEPKCVFRNLGGGVFQDNAQALTLAARTLPYVAFGAKWLDYDNDGWLDLMIANGHVQDNIHAVDPNQNYRQPTQLFHNDHGRLLVDVSDRAGASLQTPIVGRGLAIGDFENDGREGALVVDSEGAPLLLHNDSRPIGHWLLLSLSGTKSNRDGYGALVIVKTPGLTQTRLCHADGSYLSSSDKRVHVGLGPARTAQSVSVHWPDGHVDTFRHVLGDRQFRLQEGGRLMPCKPSD